MIYQFHYWPSYFKKLCFKSFYLSLCTFDFITISWLCFWHYMLIFSKIKNVKFSKTIICMLSPKTEQKILKKPPNVSRNGEEEILGSGSTWWKSGSFIRWTPSSARHCMNVIIIITSKESGYLVHTIIIEFIYEWGVEMISDNSLGSTVVKTEPNKLVLRNFHVSPNWWQHL